MVKIEVPLTVAQDAFEKHIQSIKRALNTSKQPQFKALYEAQLKEAQHALNTMTETK